MLHISPSPFWVCIWFAKFTWWRHDNTCFHCKEVTWWKWYFTFWITDGLHIEKSQVNDKLNFSRQCSEVFTNPSKRVLADRIWRYQTPPIWDAPGGFLCHRIQSAPFSCKKLLILCFISVNACCNLFLASTKLVPLSDQI